MTDNTTKGRIYTMTSPPPQADAATEQQDSAPAPGKNPLEQAQNEAAGVLQKKWDELKNGLGTLKDATGLGVSPEMATAARQRVMDGAKDMAKDAIFRVGGGGGPQERAAKAQEQVGAQIDQMRQAYSRNGLAGMAGAMATNMAMEKVAGKVIGATKTGAVKTGDAPNGSKPPTSTTKKEVPPQKTDGVHIKAIYGEKTAHEKMQAQGHEPVGKTNGEYRPGEQGIDGIYKNKTPPPDYIITESKYGTSTLGKTADGKQMSDEWLRGSDRLVNKVGKVEADRIRQALNNGNVEKWLINVKPDGTATKALLDSGASKITKSMPF